MVCIYASIYLLEIAEGRGWRELIYVCIYASLIGYGGQFRSGSTLLPVSHCFAVNGDSVHPEVEGVQGILDAYSMCIHNVALAGPTIFNLVIEQTARIASQFHKSADQKYFVLLIITDGLVNDFDATIAAIVRASSLPMSILIVGVGGADFAQMETLDGDQVRLSSGGVKAARDVVQFVPMRNFMTPSGIDRIGFSRALLEELPQQITSYFALHQIPPNPPRVVPNQGPSLP